MIKTTPLRCPVCGQRIIDAVEKNVFTKLIPKSDVKESDDPDYFQKCPKCKLQIAIIKKVG